MPWMISLLLPIFCSLYQQSITNGVCRLLQLIISVVKPGFRLAVAVKHSFSCFIHSYVMRKHAARANQNLSNNVFFLDYIAHYKTVRSHRRRRERQNSLWPPCQRRCRKIRWRSDDRTLGLVFKGAEKETSIFILCRLTTSRI